MVLVKSDLSLRVCVNKKWAEIIQNSDGSYDYKCETKALKDSSGIKIICGGDSIGVLKNLVGKDGAKGEPGEKGDQGIKGDQGVKGDSGVAGASCSAEVLKDFSGMKLVCGGDSVGVIRNGNDGDNGAGCSLKQVDENQLQIKCGDDSTTFYVNSGNGATNSSSSEAETPFELKAATITGTAVLGPFESGSVVTLKEMRIQGDSLSYTDREYTGEVSGLKGGYTIPNVTLDYPYAEISVKGKWRNEVTGKSSTEDMTLYAVTDLSEGRTNVNVNLLTHLEYARIKKLMKEKKYSMQAAKNIVDDAIVSSFGLSTDMGLAEDLVTFKSGALDNTKANATLLAMALLFVRDNDTDAKIKASIENFVNDFAADGKWDDAEGEKSKMANWATNYDADGIDINISVGGIADIPKYKVQLSTFLGAYYGIGLCDVSRGGVVKTALVNDDGTHYICKVDANAIDNASWRVATLVEWECYGKDKPKETEPRGWKSESGNIFYYDDETEWHVAQSNFEFDTYDFEYPDDNKTHVKKGNKTGSCYVYHVDLSNWKLTEEKEADLYNVDPETNSTHRGYCSDKLYVATSDASTPWRNSTKWENYLGAACLTNGKKASHRFGTPQSGEQGDSVFVCNTTKGDWEFYTKDVHEYGSWYDTRDKRTYRTITIGDQIWMAEAMMYYDCSNNSSDWCGENRNDLLNRYGAQLYTLSEAKAVCVDGWELPKAEDYLKLFVNVVDDEYFKTDALECEKLPSCAIDLVLSPEDKQKFVTVANGGTNESGFSMSNHIYWIDDSDATNNDDYVYTVGMNINGLNPVVAESPIDLVNKTGGGLGGLGVRCVKKVE